MSTLSAARLAEIKRVAGDDKRLTAVLAVVGYRTEFYHDHMPSSAQAEHMEMLFSDCCWAAEVSGLVSLAIPKQSELLSDVQDDVREALGVGE